jgi:transcriptional regulator with XRE-family HTH domain/tetratricopeptide (TPR) repeat protein
VFGQLVQGHRRRLGLTQEELATKAGLSARSIRDIEAGRTRRPRAATVRLLAEAMGLSDAEREIFRRTADGDPVVVDMAALGAADRSDVRAARCLPRPAMHFGGREAELARMLSVVAEHDPGRPLVIAIDGMAGVGKTALALEVAHAVADRYSDGQLFVDLHGHSDNSPADPVVAVELLLGQLGVPAHELPDAVQGRVARWRSELAGRRVLVVLDNVADSDQLRPLLPGLSPTLILITGRRRLAGLDSDVQQSLEPLDDAAAVALLKRVIGQRVADQAEAAREVARLCGGLPLALRLTAARLLHRPTWTLAELVARLRAAQPPVVEVCAEGLSVSAAFTLSYRQLTASAQRLLRLLGLHPGEDFDEYAAAALADTGPADVWPVLDELLDAHLVQESDGGRYRLHDLVRDYAGRLAAAGDDDVACRAAVLRLAEYYLHTVVPDNKDEPRIDGCCEPDWGTPSAHRRIFPTTGDLRRWEETEWRNLIAVTGLADRMRLDRHVCLLTRGAWKFHWSRGNAGILIRMHETALAAANRLGDEWLTAMTHNYLGGANSIAGRMRAAREHLRAAQHLWHVAGDDAAAAVAMRNLMNVEYRTGRIAAAAAYGYEALDAHQRAAYSALPQRRIDDNAAGIHRVFGECLALLGDYPRALQHLRCAARYFRAAGGYSHVLGTVLLELGRVHNRMGHRVVAPLLLRRALTNHELAGYEVGAAECLCELGLVHLMEGRLNQARRLHQLAVERMRQLDTGLGLCIALNRLAGTDCALGHAAQATALHQEALGIAERTENRYEEAVAHTGLGAALRDIDPAAAKQHAHRGRELFAEMGAVNPYHVSVRDPATPAILLSPP